jgi:hypothetical protein
LEKIPTLIDNHGKKMADLSQDLPVLREVAKPAWGKEQELKDLKVELAALDRKIQLSLKPVDVEEERREVSEKTDLTQAFTALRARWRHAL